jgi:hypothetical protein
MCIQWLQEQAAQDQRVRQSARHTELLEAHFADWTGHLLMTADRAAMGMTLEQARSSEAMSGGGASWI